MSVLVRSMEMPKNCWNCPFFHTSLHHIGDDELMERYTCLRTGERAENITGYMKNCPLIELPPHGRLIDADALCDGLVSNHPVVIHASTAPTIIPAEEADK